MTKGLLDMKNDKFIAELLTAPEGPHCQFKGAKNRFDFMEAVKCCCALSNCGGGKFVLGISDQRPREVVGSAAFDQPERTREDLMRKLHIWIDFQVYEYDDKRVLVFEVAGRPIGLPIQANGVVWWYSGDSLIPMPQEKQREIYSEIDRDFSSEICRDATMQDLDKDAIEVFRAKWAEKSGDNQIKNAVPEQLMFNCEAISDNGVTYAALVLFGTRAALLKHLPQSEIVFEYRSSEASGPAQQRVNFRVGFFACYDRIWEMINLRNDKQHYQEGLFVFDIPTFNERVVREALLNAVSHRNYQFGGSVFVRQYRDRLVVESPGGLPKGITLDNILNRQSPRNRRIAEILARCGLVERAGQGMNLIFELSIKEAKQLPDFKGTDSHFVCLTLNGLVLDERLLLFIGKIGNERLENFSTDDFLIVNNLFHEQSIPENLRPRIKRLIDMGIIEHIGRNRHILARGLYSATGKPGVHTRLKGLDRETNKELLFKHISSNKEKGTPLKELLLVIPGYNRGQVQKLLKTLKTEGRIFVKGKTSSALWFAVKK